MSNHFKKIDYYLISKTKKHKLYRVFCIQAHLNPARNNPNGVFNFSKYLHEIKTNGIDLTDGRAFDSIEKIEEQTT